MSDFKIRSSNLSYWDTVANNIKSPELDYGFLEKQLTKEASAQPAQEPIQGEEDEVEDIPCVVKDLRKSAEYSLEDVEDKGEYVDKLEENSKIPVPGMFINYENSESDYAPPTSDWVAPNGPFWNSNT